MCEILADVCSLLDPTVEFIALGPPMILCVVVDNNYRGCHRQLFNWYTQQQQQQQLCCVQIIPMKPTTNQFFVGVALADCNVPRILQLPEGSYAGGITCPTVRPKPPCMSPKRILQQCNVNAECPADQCCVDSVCQVASDGVSCGRDDPHVLGFDGMPFDFHAEHGTVLSLLTTPTLLVNARMSDMGSADGGSWMDAVGLRTAAGARLSVTATVGHDGFGCAEVVNDDNTVLFTSCDEHHTTGNTTVADVELYFVVAKNHSVLQAR